MTRDEVLRLEGRDLDAAVAERVMGERIMAIPRVGYVIAPVAGSWRSLPRYSEDIAAAWQVVECLRDSYGFGLYLEYDWGEPHAQARISNINAPGWEATADTVPVAICRAALLAVCGEGEAFEGREAIRRIEEDR